MPSQKKPLREESDKVDHTDFGPNDFDSNEEYKAWLDKIIVLREKAVKEDMKSKPILRPLTGE